MPRPDFELVVIFSVVPFGVITGFGVNVALALPGRPEILNVTELLLFTRPTVTVVEVLPPRTTVMVEADGVSVKSGVGAFTVTDTVV